MKPQMLVHPFIWKLLADGKETGKEAQLQKQRVGLMSSQNLSIIKILKVQKLNTCVVEVPVDGYTSEAEGFNITNTYTQKNQHQVNQWTRKTRTKPQLPNTSGEKALT